MADHLFIDDTQDVDGKFIGWDYAHAGDYTGYFGEERWKALEMDGKKWTTQEIFEEVKDACYQLKQLEEESPADKMFEELEYKKYEETDSKTILYIKGKRDVVIGFRKLSKLIDIVNNTIVGISMKELKAINKKVQELGWM